MKSDQAAPVRIIGGGMTGLTLALRLSRLGFPVIVHERDPYLGGLASESTLGGVPVERFYHCVLPTDRSLLALFQEIGLAEVVAWRRTRSGFHADAGVFEMTTIADLLRFPAISMWDRLRLGWTVAYCGANRTWRRLDNETVSRFLIRHGGERLFRAIWEPLLIAKLGPDYDRFAASFIWATIARMLSARKEKGKAEKLGYVRGRYGKVFAALRESIESAGGSVQAGSQVQGISRSPDDRDAPWRVRVEGKDERAKSVVMCVPAPVAAAWLGSIAPEASAKLRRVEYVGVVCDVMLVRRSLTPFYVLYLTGHQFPFTGIVEMSNLTAREEFNGHSVIYLPRYCGQASDVWNHTDDQIHQENVGGLRRIVPGFDEGDIVDWRINRARYVQPVHTLKWGSSLPPVRVAPGLAYLSTAQIHPWPVFNDEVVQLVDSRLVEVRQALDHR